MIDTQKIREEVEQAYSDEEEAGVDVPLELAARQMFSMATQYVVAAAHLEPEPRYTFPRLQLSGHAVELALKGCLASKGDTPPHGHDLLDLYERVAGRGFELDELQYACLVHLRHHYYSDLKTGTRYKARYPTKRVETLGGAIPNASTFKSIVESLRNQTSNGD